MTETGSEVARTDVLVLPLSKRMVAQRATGASGAPELHLFYSGQEVTFDEPHLFSFGETLAMQSRFQADAAMGWGAGYEWATVRPLLTHLLAAGILARAGEYAPRELTADSMVRPSPLPPAECMAPRTWAECESITRDLTGRSVEAGYLEMIVPIFRVAHIALDADRRQIGEANVFPRALRLDAPTTWVTCAYPGTRHLSDRPMNVTALKAMRLHWRPMMAALLRIREAFLRRFPDAAGAWTVGRIERLAVLVLAVPTYQLVKATPLSNGEMHPVLSSLFRVTDGLRMTMHQMLFVPIGEPTVSPEQPVTSAGIFDYAERNYSFHSDTGVCAGPKHMIQEFLRVLVDGDRSGEFGSVELDPAVEAALSDMEAAFDYGLLGLQVHAALFSLWPAMARTYAELADIAEAAVRDGDPTVADFRDRLQGHVASLKTGTYLGTESRRAHREMAYAEMFDACAQGLAAAGRGPAFADQIAPAPMAEHTTVAAALGDALRRRLGPAAEVHVIAMQERLMTFLIHQQGLFRAAETAQRRINEALERPMPVRPFQSADADVHNLMQGAAIRRVPYLLDELEETLGVRLVIESNHMKLSEPPVAVGAPH